MIYYIQDRNSLSIKIGYTKAEGAEGRQKALQTGNPAELVLLLEVPGELEDEKRLHERFAGARLVGEWFRPVPELLRHILTARCQPEAPAAVPAKRPWPWTIYLAGKISKGDWREGIVSQVPCPPDDDPGEWPDGVASSGDQRSGSGVVSEELPAEWPIMRRAIFGTHNYSGPFFIRDDHGGYHGDDTHGVFANGRTLVEWGCDGGKHGGPTCAACSNDPWEGKCEGNVMHKTWRSREVHALCHKAIAASDLVFAWIDQPDCYGTVAEIGYAHSQGKLIWIAGPRRYRDMWFVYEYADEVNFYHSDPKVYLSGMLAIEARRREPVARLTP